MSGDIDADLTRINKRLDVLEGKAPSDPTDPNLAGDQLRSIMGRLDRLEAIEKGGPDVGQIDQRLEALEVFRHRIEALAGAQPTGQYPAGSGDIGHSEA